ncbi:MAG: hypothetical protein ACKO6N_16855 [Myxococcota bacterium]
MVVHEGSQAESGALEELVKYTPRVGDVGALVERYSISEFTYHTWRNPLLDARYRTSNTGTSATPLSTEGRGEAPMPVLGSPVSARVQRVVPPSQQATAPATQDIRAPSAPVLTSWTAEVASQSFVRETSSEQPSIPAVVHAPLPADHGHAVTEREDSMKPEQTWATLQPPTHPVPVPLIRWTEPEDLMNRPLPILASLPDVSGLVQQLAQRPRRVMAAQVQTLHPAEAQGVASLSSLLSDPLSARPIMLTHLPIRPAGGGTSLNGHRTAPESRALRQADVSRGKEASAGPVGDPRIAAQIPLPAPQDLPHSMATAQARAAVPSAEARQSAAERPPFSSTLSLSSAVAAPPMAAAPPMGVSATPASAMLNTGAAGNRVAYSAAQPVALSNTSSLTPPAPPTAAGSTAALASGPAGRLAESGAGNHSSTHLSEAGPAAASPVHTPAPAPSARELLRRLALKGG